MSDQVTLALRSPLEESIDLDVVVPDRLATLGAADIAVLPVWAGRQQRTLGDYFDVRGGHSATVRIEGDVRHARGIGAGMAASGASLTIDGHVGSHIGAGMSGGSIEVLGDAGNDTGAGMTGGSIHVRGNTGDRVGAASPGASRGVTGGEIVVRGSAGADAGARMRRGLLFIGGDTGQTVARDIIAGTVMVMGRTGVEPASRSKRGTLVVAGEIDVPVTYRYACRYQPPHVRLALTYLVRRYQLDVDARFVGGTYDRYCGDAGTVSKGEILKWIRE